MLLLGVYSYSRSPKMLIYRYRGLDRASGGDALSETH
jgi:hypothetical protein